MDNVAIYELSTGEALAWGGGLAIAFVIALWIGLRSRRR